MKKIREKLAGSIFLFLALSTITALAIITVFILSV